MMRASASLTLFYHYYQKAKQAWWTVAAIEMKAPLLASLALFLLACTAHAAPLRSSSSNLVFKQVVLFWKFLAVSEAFSVVIHGAAALPRASCVVSATDFNATLTFVSTRNSISPPYGFGVSATVTVSGACCFVLLLLLPLPFLHRLNSLFARFHLFPHRSFLLNIAINMF